MVYLEKPGNYDRLRKSAVAVGKFDGLHRGHMLLIDKLKALATENSWENVVLTFKNRGKGNNILTDDEKRAALERAGVGACIVFEADDKFLQTTADEFINDILMDKLNCAAVVAGEGFRFGRGRVGDADLLRERGIAVCELPILPGISSETIRGLIAVGNIPGARELLGYDYYVTGTVELGKRLGGRLGFPTANITPPQEKLLPPDGVYVTRTAAEGVLYKSVTNVGVNPTVTVGGTRKVETFILGYDGDLYGKAVKIEFVRKLRGEVRFGSVEELREQIGKDIAEAER